MSKQEIRRFENACVIERREDGIYVRHEQVAEFAGPYSDAFTALRSYRLVWAVE